MIFLVPQQKLAAELTDQRPLRHLTGLNPRIMAQESDTEEISLKYSWYVLCILTLSFTVSFIDRQVLTLLIDPIKSDLNIVNIIGNNESNITLYPYLTQDAIKGVFYYDYSNYSKLNGQITFYNNKPIICARYNLWGGFESPSSIIEKINNLPKDPYSAEGYSLIPIHNWSYSVDTLIKIVQGFDENINVVAPDEFLNLISSKLLDKYENIVQLSNYPNPTNNYITLEFLGHYEEIKTIEIYNMQGKNINIPYLMDPINSYLTKIQFNLEIIAAGTYFISLTNSNNTKVTTIVIKK